MFDVQAQWSWVVPPLSSGLTQVFGHEMRDFRLEPQYAYQAEIWDIRSGGELQEDDGSAATTRIKEVIILFASETGKQNRVHLCGCCTSLLAIV